jgi:hypothetical protein
VASVSGRRYFGVSADGFFGPTSGLTLVAEGTITTGRIRYGLLDAKVFTNMAWRTDPLAGTVTAEATYDTGAETEIGSQSAAGTTSSGVFSLGPTPAEWLELTFTLARSSGDTTEGPCLRWWVTKAIPAPQTTERIILPLVCKRVLRLPNGNQVNFDPVRALQHIESLVQSQEVVSYQEGTRSDNVYVVNFEQRPSQWNDADGCLESLLFVEMLTV